MSPSTHSAKLFGAKSTHTRAASAGTAAKSLSYSAVKFYVSYVLVAGCQTYIIDTVIEWEVNFFLDGLH